MAMGLLPKQCMLMKMFLPGNAALKSVTLQENAEAHNSLRV